MSSLPSISHHLFVAAVKSQQGQTASSSRNHAIEKLSDEKLASDQEPAYEESPDPATAVNGATLIVTLS